MKLAKRFRGIAIVAFCLLTMSTVLVFTLGANYPADYAIGTISGVFSIAVALHCFIHRSFVLGSISLALGILGIILSWILPIFFWLSAGIELFLFCVFDSRCRNSNASSLSRRSIPTTRQQRRLLSFETPSFANTL